MYIWNRTIRFIRGFLMSYGPSSLKKVFWDQEFSSGKWNFIDYTAGDCVYLHLERFAHNADILDLGCGPGNTANELAPVYSSYVGVDISEEALAKARRRTVETGRSEKNRFERSDFINYEPAQKFDVILFRESMYHVPLGKIKPMLDRYAEFLNDGGVFIVRLYLVDLKSRRKKPRPTAMMRVVEKEFDVVEKREYGDSQATVIVFRAHSSSNAKTSAPLASAREHR